MNNGFSFIHAADLHLDSTFGGLARLPAGDPLGEGVLETLRECTFAALNNIIDACIKHRVDFLVLAGDIYDLADRSLRAELRLQKAFERLAEVGISVFVAHGNHDHGEGFQADLAWPQNVCFFAPGAVEARPVLRDGKELTRVYGISYPRRDVSDNYAALFKRDKDAPFALAVLHCNVGGNAEHANYAPCSLDELRRSGFDYWALGHVHRGMVLHEHSPWVVYPGNPQGRNQREAGARGCYLVRVKPGGAASMEFLATDVVRWATVSVPIEGLHSEQDLLEAAEIRLTELGRVNPGRSLVTRLELVGRGMLHRRLRHSGLLEGLLDELRCRVTGGVTGSRKEFIWVDSIRRNTAALLDKEALRDSQTLLGDLLAISRSAREGDTVRESLLGLLEPFYHRAARYIEPPGEAELSELLEAAEDMVMDMLLEEDAG